MKLQARIASLPRRFARGHAILVLAAIALPAVPLMADQILLQGGGRLTGEIVAQTEETVTIDIGAGQMTVKMATVVGIEKGSSPLQEYRARAATLADGDVDGWRTLARWATQYALAAQAQEAWTHVRKVLPNDAEANSALGLVLYDGKWISADDSYRARGFVEFEGAWMTPAEQKMILEERQTREATERQALAAEIKASEEERRAREAEEEAREAEERARDNKLPMLGDPVYWSYGYGPSVWPVTPVQPPLEGDRR